MFFYFLFLLSVVRSNTTTISTTLSFSVVFELLLATYWFDVEVMQSKARYFMLCRIRVRSIHMGPSRTKTPPTSLHLIESYWIPDMSLGCDSKSKIYLKFRQKRNFSTVEIHPILPRASRR